MEELKSTEEILARITDYVTRKRYSDVEDIWLSLLESQPDNVDLFIQLADEMSKLGQRNRAGLCLLLLYPHYKDKGNWDAAFEIIHKAGEFIPHESDVRGFLIECYKNKYSFRNDVDTALNLSKLEDEETNIRKGLQEMDHYLAFNKDDYVLHASSWGVGKIQSVDLIKGQLVVDFKIIKNKNISLNLASKILKQLDPDHLDVWKFAKPDELKELVEKDPVKLLTITVKSINGPADLKKIKDNLMPSVITQDDWSKWWTKTRKLAAQDHHLKLEKGTPMVISVRDIPVTGGSEELDEILTEKDNAKFIEESYALMRSDGIHQDTIKKLVENLEARAKDFNLSEHIVQAKLMLDELCRSNRLKHTFEPDMDANLNKYERKVDLLLKVDVQQLRREIFKVLLSKSTAEDAKQLCLDILQAELSHLWDDASKHLIDNNFIDPLIEMLDKFKLSLREWPEQFYWLATSILSDKFKVQGREFDKGLLLEKLFYLLAFLDRNRTPDNDRLSSRCKSFLTASRGKLFQKILKESPGSVARHVLKRVRTAAFINSRQRGSLESYVARARPEAFQKPDNEFEDEEDETEFDENEVTSKDSTASTNFESNEIQETQDNA